MRHVLGMATLILLSGPIGAALAEDKPEAAANAPLTAEELAEREARKGCKASICAAFRNQSEGADVACSVIKTWRKATIDKMISGAKVSWPYGNVRCTADVKLKREALIKAAKEERFESQLDKHQIRCTVEMEKSAPAEIKFELAPKVTFEKGKATKTQMNWGTIEAPTLVKGAMWTATATDNTFNVLQSAAVDDINKFFSAQCDEIQSEWAGK